MGRWLTIALAAKLAKGTRRTELEALLRAKPAPSDKPQVIVATPRRFLSLRKLLKPNAAVDAMLRTLQTGLALATEKGLTTQLDLSDTPAPCHAPALYLSHHTVESPAFAALRARGTHVMHFKAADLPGRTSLDPLGFAGWSSLADKTAQELDLEGATQAEIDTYFDEAKAAAISGNVSKYAQSDAQEALPERYVFLALQTIGDMVQRNAYVPMLDMLAMVIERFEGSPFTVVVKRHPKCRSRRVSAALETASRQPHVQISQGSIHQLLSGASAVFTVNSGVGSEAIIHEKPLYCFGKADYAPVAHQIRSRTDLAKATDPLRDSCTEVERKRFLFYYRNIYQFRQEDELRPRLSALIEKALHQAQP